MFRVLLVEDDARWASLISEYLSNYEFLVDHVSRGDEALAHFRRTSPDIVILDLMLPGLDGMIVCRTIRAENSAVPILILTAREDVFDEVSGLEQGADDYVNKPVQPRVLLARLRALLRRLGSTAPTAPSDLVFDALVIARDSRTVHWHGVEIDLSATEYKILLALAESAGVVLSRDDLLQKVRGVGFDGLDRRIDNNISRLRKKFDDPDGVKIKTAWGEGYLFTPSAWG